MECLRQCGGELYGQLLIRHEYGKQKPMLALSHCGLLSAVCAESIINQNSGLLRRLEALRKARHVISGCHMQTLFGPSQ
jgi:hypothetical protein